MASAAWLERPEREEQERSDLLLSLLQVSPGTCHVAPDIGGQAASGSYVTASASPPTARRAVEARCANIRRIAARDAGAYQPCVRQYPKEGAGLSAPALRAPDAPARLYLAIP